MSPRLEVVFLDVGGPLYDDQWYYRSLLRAMRELDPRVVEEDFRREYEAARRAQSGSFRTRLTKALLDPSVSVEEVTARAERYWHYPPEALLPDVLPALRVLADSYRLGVIANQQAWVREAMRRDGIEGFFEIWAISEELGVEKPDPRIFRSALDLAGVPPERCVMVGDRLDNDVIPARAAGMTAVWLLRGEAPDEPTPEQLDRTDVAIRSLLELPPTLATLTQDA